MDIFTSFLRLPLSIFSVSVIRDPITWAAFQGGTVGRPLEPGEKWPPVLLLPSTVAFPESKQQLVEGRTHLGRTGLGLSVGKGLYTSPSNFPPMSLCLHQEALGRKGHNNKKASCHFPSGDETQGLRHDGSISRGHLPVTDKELSTALGYSASRWTVLTLVPMPSPAHLLILPSSSLTNVFWASNGAAELYPIC